MSDYSGPRAVTAAQRGDQRALDELIASYLPLVYNIVGRALQGHADVDDVVQETMLKVVNGLDGLRDPAAFRSWLVSIAMREVRDSRRRGGPVDGGGLEEVQGTADPGADFVDLTILRLGLSDQRRETAEATRWLDEADRDLLSLWWLEAAGQITRAELATALELTPSYAAVRVQRMKAHLETARAVVRAVWAVPRCASLDLAIQDWDGHPSSLWRKRLARHVRECAQCSSHHQGLVPAESLLAGMALVPLPTAGLQVIGHAGAGGAEGSGIGPASDGTSPRRSRRRTRAKRPRLLTRRPVVASAAVSAVLCAGCLIAISGQQANPSPDTAQAADTAPGQVAEGSAPATASPSATSTLASPTASPRTKSTPSASPARTGQSPTPSAKATATGPVYGQTVDTVDTVPAPDTLPGTLPKRPETDPVTVTGSYSEPFKGSLGGQYLMFYSGQYTTITGKGYFAVRYEIGWFNRVGQMVMPTWTGLEGKLFHVASGGGRRMDDTHPGQATGNTWMGTAETGYITLPSGAQQMWNNEYFYLDGTVTLHENEAAADYNLSVTPWTWDQINTEINTPPNADKGLVRYGLVRDTGDDAAPVPQYLTRSTPAEASTVPQRSKVTPTS
ncbi:sigma-70 family RNA polymerase sigma factor [Streptomyces sp. NPDC003247]|uniref:RNA polymerase sigma factor n=1 Tax=Streptomyces sp. NPDC003247 TaxID=3364677 RepID=UPI0036D06B21